MAQRRFGPTRGAGVVIEEQQGEQTIQPAALGWVGYAGLLEKGAVGELIVASSPQQLFKKTGGIIPESLLPDACSAYFKTAAGAGGILLVRITDGNEEQAAITLFQRKTDGANPLPVPMGTVKAKNGGRWGGAARRYTGELANISDLTETTLDTGITMKQDLWKGGYIELEEVPNVRYQIIGNDAAGLITVTSDQTMLTDYGAGTSLRYYLTLESGTKQLSVLIGDGEDDPDNEFSLTPYVDGVAGKKYANLSTDPSAARYWVNLINNDDANDEIVVEDLIEGAHTAATRPANVYGVIASVTATALTQKLHRFTIDGAGDPTMVLGTTDDSMVGQEITLTMTSATAFTAASDKFGSLGTGAFGALFTPNNKWTPPFTITAGGTPMVSGDTIKILYVPLLPGSLAGGYLYPDKPNAKRSRFRIVSNTHKVITVVAGSDLTADGAADDKFLVEAPQPLVGGVDGHAGVTDADFENKAWSPDSSPFNRIEGRNLGLVKMASPGNTATAVQRAGAAYAQAKNHQYRYEIPSNITTEEGALAYINDTIGRNDFAVVSLPSYSYVSDPNGGSEGKLKLVSSTGMIHGREARIAADYDGYHKAQAGIDATLPAILKLPTGEALLNEELLNPAGISVIKKKKGNYVIWGDRTLYLDSAWKFKHHRELMSYYEHVLQENFDFVIFALNDELQQKPLLATLRQFFRAELVKRAIRGNTLDEAAIIKIDSENNTDATRADGDLFADLALKLADTIERFRIRIGKQGIFESVA